MATASLILGLLGLLGLVVSLPLLSITLFFGGGACGLAAVILGLLARRSGDPGRAGIVLGLVTMIGALAMLLLFTSSGPPPAPPIGGSAPPAHE